MAGCRCGVGEVEAEVFHVRSPFVLVWVDIHNGGFFFHKRRVVLANGSTRMQLDLMKSSDLPFHMLFSSQLLGKTKVGSFGMCCVDMFFLADMMQPDSGAYTKALDLMQVAPSEAIMVAAHAYDLRAAKTV